MLSTSREERQYLFLRSSEIGNRIKYSGKNYQISFKQMLDTLQENVQKKKKKTPNQETVVLGFVV